MRREREAAKAREDMARAGLTLPPVCGWIYTRRVTRGKKNELFEATCMRNAGQGTEHQGTGFCNYHEAESTLKLTKLSARSQVNAARSVVQSRLRFFGEPVNIGPHDALLQEVQRTAGIVQWLEDKLVKLKDEDGMPEDAILIQYTKMGIMPSAWMTLYMEERKHLVSVSAAAIKAGVAERKVQIIEQQARIIAAVMLHFIHDPDLALSAHQIVAAPAIIRKHMAALPLTSNETKNFDGGKIIDVALSPAGGEL